MRESIQYKRLPGRRLSLLGVRSYLWLGPDHILHVTHRGYSEEYKRFYFSDIQAIFLRPTTTGRILALIFSAIAGLAFLFCVAGWFLWKWGSTGLWISGSIAAFWILVALYHIVRGATCACHLKTAVQTETLPSLYRKRAALKTLAILRARIEEFQGSVSEEDWLSAGAPGMYTAAAPQEPESVPAMPVYSYTGYFHTFLFSMLILDGFRIVWTLFAPAFALYVAGLFLYSFVVFGVVGAMIRQRNSDLPGFVKGTVWCIFVYVWLIAAAWYVYSIFSSIESPDAGLNYWALLRFVAEQSPLSSVPLLILHSFSAFCSLLFGISGVIALSGYYRARKK